ncbi:hypothetical protein LEP1GSC020_3841 [Leptospira interrogans serovar Grippotyphosa str. 2006006986]|nr:hypothetical protein LEP1GSC020_3841 [Leptospira interrogans serovar Grippotyphosa str. 2006006986]EMJ64012.1 hypothetical protein LEP1GSC197_3665 [Leptospira interrogans serovar Pomona str. CSL4002]
MSLYFQQITWDDSKLKESKLMIVSKNIYNDLDEIKTISVSISILRLKVFLSSL